jgi:hypothetical protein
LSIDRDHHFTMRKISTLLALSSDIFASIYIPFWSHCLGGTIVANTGGIGGRDYGKNILDESILELAHPNYNPQTNQYDMALIFLEDIIWPKLLTYYIYSTPNSKLQQLLSSHLGSTTNVLGWGDMEADGVAATELIWRFDLQVTSNEDCARMQNMEGTL